MRAESDVECTFVCEVIRCDHARGEPESGSLIRRTPLPQHIHKAPTGGCEEDWSWSSTSKNDDLEDFGGGVAAADADDALGVADADADAALVCTPSPQLHHPLH